MLGLRLGTPEQMSAMVVFGGQVSGGGRSVLRSDVSGYCRSARHHAVMSCRWRPRASEPASTAVSWSWRLPVQSDNDGRYIEPCILQRSMDDLDREQSTMWLWRTPVPFSALHSTIYASTMSRYTTRSWKWVGSWINFSGLTPRIPRTVYRYFWAYPFLLFCSSFFHFQFLVPCGRLNWLMSAFDRVMSGDSKISKQWATSRWNFSPKRRFGFADRYARL